MEELKNIRLSVLADGTMRIEGDNHLGYRTRLELNASTEYECPRISSSCFECRIDGYLIRLNFKDFDMRKPIAPLRLRGLRPRQNYLYAVHAMVAEVSYYACGFADTINKDYLLNTPEVAIFIKDDAFDLDLALSLFLKAAGVDDKADPHK